MYLCILGIAHVCSAHALAIRSQFAINGVLSLVPSFHVFSICYLSPAAAQVDSAERGFSFQRDGPLDMRMAPGAALDAATIVNGWPEAELGRLFREYGEERSWRRIASRLVPVQGFTTSLKPCGTSLLQSTAPYRRLQAACSARVRPRSTTSCLLHGPHHVSS